MTLNDYIKLHTDSEGMLDSVATVTFVFVITSVLNKVLNEIFYKTDIKELDK